MLTAKVCQISLSVTRETNADCRTESASAAALAEKQDPGVKHRGIESSFHILVKTSADNTAGAVILPVTSTDYGPRRGPKLPPFVTGKPISQPQTPIWESLPMELALPKFKESDFDEDEKFVVEMLWYMLAKEERKAEEKEPGKQQ